MNKERFEKYLKDKSVEMTNLNLKLRQSIKKYKTLLPAPKVSHKKISFNLDGLKKKLKIEINRENEFTFSDFQQGIIAGMKFALNLLEKEGGE